jgi:hypothetical protein
MLRTKPKILKIGRTWFKTSPKGPPNKFYNVKIGTKNFALKKKTNLPTLVQTSVVSISCFDISLYKTKKNYLPIK